MILRTEKDGESLTADEVDVFHKGTCPDCLSRLVEGPHGGLSVNYYCGGDNCGSRFNFMGPFGVDRISNASPKSDRRLIDRSHRRAGTDW